LYFYFCLLAVVFLFRRRPGLHIAIEGGIAVGKSSLIDAVVKEFAMLGIVFTGILEPTPVWQSFGPDRVDLLEMMYDKPADNAFMFQVMAYTTKYQELGPLLRENRDQHLLVERTLDAQKKVFIPLLHQKGYLSNTARYLLVQAIEMADHEMTPDLIVFIRASASVCFDRIQRRGRAAEKDISLDYLRAIDTLYTEWEVTAENAIHVVSVDNNELETAKRIVSKIIIWAAKNGQMRRLLNMRVVAPGVQMDFSNGVGE
jgi:deoxyadenosine/deoxycytidine kinase